jgi:hypothetical protein
MNALSLLPPGFKGVERGCGSSEFAFVIADVTDEGGGERMKPPDWAGGVDMAVPVCETQDSLASQQSTYDKARSRIGWQ